MRQRPRLRWVLKWVGLATCVLILELLGINVFRGTIWVSGSTDPSSDASFVFYLQDGSVITGVWEQLPPSPVPPHTFFHRWGGGGGGGVARFGGLGLTGGWSISEGRSGDAT